MSVNSVKPAELGSLPSSVIRAVESKAREIAAHFDTQGK